MPRRRPGVLLPIEISILAAAIQSRSTDEPEFHGFQIAKTLQDSGPAGRLTGHGTLYKALARLERDGLLRSRWEEPDVALLEGRPRRRLYSVTGVGELAVSAAPAVRPARRPLTARRGMAPS